MYQKLLIIVVVFFIISCSSRNKNPNIQVIYESLEDEILRNNIFRNNTIRPLLRKINELYFTDNKQEKYYISCFSYKDSSKLNISNYRGILSNDIWNKDIRKKIQYSIKKMKDLRILEIQNDSLKTEIYTEYNWGRNNEKLVFVFSKVKSNSLLKNKIIAWLSQTNYVYKTNKYKELNNIEDAFDPYFIRWLELN